MGALVYMANKSYHFIVHYSEFIVLFPFRNAHFTIIIVIGDNKEHC